MADDEMKLAASSVDNELEQGSEIRTPPPVPPSASRDELTSELQPTHRDDEVRPSSLEGDEPVETDAAAPPDLSTSPTLPTEATQQGEHDAPTSAAPTDSDAVEPVTTTARSPPTAAHTANGAEAADTVVPAGPTPSPIATVAAESAEPSSETTDLSAQRAEEEGLPHGGGSSTDNASSPRTEGEAEPDTSSPRQHHSDYSRHTTPATSTGEASEDKERAENQSTSKLVRPELPSMEVDLTAKPPSADCTDGLAPQYGDDDFASTPPPPPQLQSQSQPSSSAVPGATPSATPAAHTAPQAEPVDAIRPAYFYPMDPSYSSDPRQNQSEDGVPVFEPTMEQFQDFYAFCQAIDKWGMRSGIVKIVPPKEWTESLPSLKPRTHDAKAGAGPEAPADISSVRIKNAILQHFSPAGSGVWRQTNVTRTVKVWNAKQWADTCITPDQKGPEMERMKWKVEVDGVTNGGWGPKKLKEGEVDPHAAILEEDGVRTRSGKARSSMGTAEAKAGIKRKRAHGRDPTNLETDGASSLDQVASGSSGTPPAVDDEAKAEPCPQTPEKKGSVAGLDVDVPSSDGEKKINLRRRLSRSSLSQSQQPPRPIQASPDASEPSASPTKAKKVPWADTTTAEEWDKFDYERCWLLEGLSPEQIEQHRQAAGQGNEGEGKGEGSELTPLPDPSAWDEATCREIESEYWRSLNFGKPPMYGADLKGTLFDERTKHWNVGKLDNLLTRLRLRRKLPGVTTPYLYWGMWRATFAWHVEDMDLYSINYIHFGAPKQWYSIRQADRQRFESAMAGAFPSDSRRCPHFMRHKSYLASPSFLAGHGIRPLRLVHNAGEFVITYPYGYHSGFNLGYNCAESVNFALETWLDIGRKANYCHCDQAQQSVRMDVDAMLEESRELEEADKRKEMRKVKEEGLKAVEEEELEKRRKRNEKAREARKLKKEKNATIEAPPDEQVRAPEELALAASLAMMASASVPVARPSQRGEDADEDPCVFCPSQIRDDLVRIPETGMAKGKSAKGKFAHRFCASFIPETWVGRSEDGKYDIVCGVEGIEKARYSLKCQICPTPALQKIGAKIQCTRGRCPRSAHVSCALIEDEGWFIDVCTREVADRLEAKTDSHNKGSKKKKKHGVEAAAVEQQQQQQQESIADSEERLVVLCKSHNPLFKQAEEARKAEEIRERILQLPVPSVIKIKSSGGVFEATMTEVRDLPDGQGEVVIDDQGRPRAIKFGRILLEGKLVEVPKSEPFPESVVGTEPLQSPGKSNATRPKKRAAASGRGGAAAVEEAAGLESIGKEDGTVQVPPAKRSRRATEKGEAAAANAAAVDEVVAAGRPTVARKARASTGKKAGPAKAAASKPTTKHPAPGPSELAGVRPQQSFSDDDVPQAENSSAAAPSGPLDYAGRSIRHAYHLAHPGAPSAPSQPGSSAFPQFGQRYGVYGPPPSVLFDSRGGPAPGSMPDYASGHPDYAVSHPPHRAYRMSGAAAHDWQQYDQLAVQPGRFHSPTVPAHYRHSPQPPFSQASPLPLPSTSRDSSHSDPSAGVSIGGNRPGHHEQGRAHGPGFDGYNAARMYDREQPPSSSQGYSHVSASLRGSSTRPCLPQYMEGATYSGDRRFIPSYREGSAPLATYQDRAFARDPDVYSAATDPRSRAEHLYPAASATPPPPPPRSLSSAGQVYAPHADVQAAHYPSPQHRTSYHQQSQDQMAPHEAPPLSIPSPPPHHPHRVRHAPSEAGAALHSPMHARHPAASPSQYYDYHELSPDPVHHGFASRPPSSYPASQSHSQSHVQAARDLAPMYHHQLASQAHGPSHRQYPAPAASAADSFRH